MNEASQTPPRQGGGSAERPVRIEPSGKRVRVMLGGQVVADTTDALYVWEHGRYPQYYLPRRDVTDGVLSPSGRTVESQTRGTAECFDVRAGGREAPDGAWTYATGPVEALRDRVRFDFDAMDAWFEEDEEIFVHPRDPATRVQILPSSRRATVMVDDVVVADTRRPTFLYETGLRRRTYFSPLDVRMDMLVASPSSSRCPYKGTARWWHVVTPSGTHQDLAWSYPAPLTESAGIAGLIAFYDEHATVEVEGEGTGEAGGA